MEVVGDLKECPDCKVDARLMDSIAQEEKAKGKMGEDLVANTYTRVITNLDATRPPMIGARIPSARVYSDICMKCGREYNFRIEKGHVTMPARADIPPVFA